MAMRLLVLVCGLAGASSSVAPVAAWVAPSCSFRGAPSCSLSGSAGRRASAPASLHLAVQDKILEGLRTKWPSNGQGETEQSINGSDTPQQPSRQPIPFVIQRIGRGNKREIEEITQMCIDVFFNEQEQATLTGEDKKRVPPWKRLQLAYLGNMQTGDLLARNAFKKDQLVDLIIARRVYPASEQVNGNAVGDLSQIYNPDYLPAPNGSGYVTGEIIGYCEVSEKNFGLGGKFQTQQPPQQPRRRRGKSGDKSRPYLSNLSVVEYARQSGVGSRLLDECEDAVRGWNAGHTEIVLQVEEDNPTAIQFYKRRGWEFVFADPTCRRFDTSGIILRETRITKYAMIKRLTEEASGNEKDAADDPGSSLIQQLRNSFFVKR